MATKGKIDWASKQLGDGTAVDVPKYLLAIQSKDEAQRVEASRWLTNALLEGSAYPDIGPLVVSELLEAVRNNAPDQAAIIELLVEISLFGHAPHAVTGVTHKKFRGPLAKAYETFSAARDVFVGLLKAPEARTRAAAAFALAFIVDEAAETAKALQAHLKGERERLVTSSCLLALGLTVRHGAPLASALEAGMRDGDAMVRAAAAIGLGVAEQKPAPSTTTALVEALELPRTELLWFEGRLSYYSVRVLTHKTEFTAPIALPALRGVLEKPQAKALDEYAQLMLVDATIQLGFTEFAGRAGNPVTRGELSEQQLEFLGHLEALGRRTATFAEYGLPREPSAIGLLTGAGAAAPLDRTVEVVVDQSQKVPLWKCLHLVFERKLDREELSRALQTQVPKSELFPVLIEACSGKNDVPVLPPPITIECLDYLGKEAIEPGRKLAEQLSTSKEPYSPGLAILSLNALVRNGVKTLPDEFGAVAARLSRARTPLGLEEVVASLSADARAKYQLQGG